MAVKNSCTPQNIYGPYQHTLFLGLSVLDFTASAGWNEQFSTLTVKLVQDPCSGDRKYLNASYNWVTSNFPNGDPGFNGVVGQAAIFKVEDFEFAGIIQSVTVTRGSDGNPLINVSLIAPGVILEGTQVIIDGYAGTVSSLPNVVNLYAFLEAQDANCPQIGGFGSPAGGFGFARRTDRGIPWALAKPGLQVLLGGTGDALYSPYGGMKWKSGSSGYGLIASDLYVLDISDLPTTAGIDYRIPGPSASVLEVISTVCRDAGYDFYVDLLPSKGGPGGVLTNLIKIRTISRVNQPALTAISTFVSSRNDIIQNSIGQEMRTDNNSAFIVGAQKRDIYQGTSIVPFWGFGDDGTPNSAIFTDLGDGSGQWQVSMGIYGLNLSLKYPLASNTLVVSETELLLATSDIDTFRDSIIIFHSGSQLYDYITDTLGIKPIIRLPDSGISTTGVGEAHPIDHMVFGGVSVPDAVKQEDLDTLHQFLSSYVGDIYGKKFLVEIPWVCLTTDTDTGEYLWSDLPSTEGGWSETSNILGMPFPSTYTNTFSDEQGKVQPILRFPIVSGLNLKDFKNDDYVVDSGGGYIWSKADIHDQWVIQDNKAHALISVSSPMRISSEAAAAVAKFRVLGGVNFRNNTFTKEQVGGVSKGVDAGGSLIGSADQPFILPDAAACPVVSNTQTYGPWIAAASAKGTVYFEKDDGLAPWEYGGYAYMNAAATAKIASSITEMQTSERGSVTIPGYPPLGLGSAINATVSSVTSRAINTSPAQGGSYYYTSAYGTDSSAAQISNINVTISPQGVTTQVDLSTFTPVFGRFTRGNAERLKQIGQLRYKSYREIDNKMKALRSGGAGGGGGGGSSKAEAAIAGGFGGGGRDAASTVFIAKRVPISGGYYQFGPSRTSVIVSSSMGASNFDDYDNAAMMTIDGLLKPIKKIGSTISGQFVNEVADPNPPSGTTYTIAPIPPIKQYTGLIISTDYLDFLANPDSPVTTRSDSPGEGHNIEGVARKGKVDLESSTGVFTITKAREVGGVGYEDDYRYLGLRGPLVIHGWGYDVMGKPVPNASGDYSGIISSNYDYKTDKFHSGWLQNDALWPAAPVDLRYDRKRGVWTIPPGFRILYVDNPCVIPYGTSKEVTVLNADVYDASGSGITGISIDLYNITTTDICPGRLMAYYDEENGQYWPLFPGGSECNGCECSECTYVAVVTGVEPDTGLEWQPAALCCGNYTCSDPTGTPTIEGEYYTGTCVTCSGNECIYTGFGGAWVQSGTGCCEEFRCIAATGAPTGDGDIQYSTCEPCDGGGCIYSGVGGNWVGGSGNCNGECGSGTYQCSEPTGSPTGSETQTGTCIPCDEYPCRWISVDGTSWQETGVGCTGCTDDASSPYECISPTYAPTSQGQIATSTCKPPSPTGGGCAIEQVELVCGGASGITVKTTTYTFDFIGGRMVCSEGATVETECDTCCGGGNPPGDPPGSDCGMEPCGYTAWCNGVAGQCNCNIADLKWTRQGPACPDGCGCTDPPDYAPSVCGEGAVGACAGGPEVTDDPGGPPDDEVDTDPTDPTLPPIDPTSTDPTIPTLPGVDDGGPIVCTFPGGQAWPKVPIRKNPNPPWGWPGILMVRAEGDMGYNTSAIKTQAMSRYDYKPVRARWGVDYFNTEHGSGSGYYPNHDSMAGFYELKNKPKSISYQISQTCTDTGCLGDACEWESYLSGTAPSTGWAWQLTVECTKCACKCVYPGSPPTGPSETQISTCVNFTGTGGAPITGYRYTATTNYEDNIPSGSNVTIIWDGDGYKVHSFKAPCITISGDFNRTSFYKDSTILANASTGNIVITLPLSTGNGIPDTKYNIKKIDSSSNLVIVSGSGNDTIDGSSTYTLYNQWEAATFVACHSAYYVI